MWGLALRIATVWGFGVYYMTSKEIYMYGILHKHSWKESCRPQSKSYMPGRKNLSLLHLHAIETGLLGSIV